MMKTGIEKQKPEERMRGEGVDSEGKNGECRKKDKEGGDRMENSVGV